MDLFEETDIDANQCHICLENGKYELTETRFQLNDEDLLLLTAYNRFSTFENVSIFVWLHLTWLIKTC